MATLEVSSWEVRVVDGFQRNAAAVRGATVLVWRNPDLGAYPYKHLTSTFPPWTDSDQSPGCYVPPEDGPTRLAEDNNPEGSWGLLVCVPGKSLVFQPFVVGPESADNAIPYATTAKDGIEAETVDIKAVAGNSVVTTFYVTVVNESEVVMLSGTHYHVPGAPLAVYAKTRRNDLYRPLRPTSRDRPGVPRHKSIDEGTLVTVFSCDARTRFVYVAAIPVRADRRWLKIGEIKKAPVPEKITPGNLWPFTPDSRHHHQVISITDLYDYLAEVGRTRPGVVREVSIFSHAWPMGPILYSTDESPLIKATEARDPDDYDGRLKDFKCAGHPWSVDLAKAMATNASWHIWGCQRDSPFTRRAIAAMNPNIQAPDQFFDVDAGTERPGRTNRNKVRWGTIHRLRTMTYSAVLAQFLGRGSVFAAAPGSWADYSAWPTDHPNDGRFRIGWSCETWSQASADPGAFVVLLAYYRYAFQGLFNAPPSTRNPTHGEVDGDGYIDYGQFRNVAPLDYPVYSEYYQLGQDGTTATLDLDGQASDEPTKNQVTVDLKHMTSASVNIQAISDIRQIGGSNPYRSAASPVSGHCYTLIDKQTPTKRWPFLAVQDGDRVHVFELDANGNMGTQRW